jgi:membrane protease YdiL (CAAX protease family)
MRGVTTAGLPRAAPSAIIAGPALPFGTTPDIRPPSVPSVDLAPDANGRDIPSMTTSPPRSLLGPAIAFEGGLAVLALGLGWLLGHPPLVTARIDLEGVGLGVAATLPMLLGLWGCLRSKATALAEIRALVEELLLPLFAGSSLGAVALISALAGLGEEMLFRGVLQPAIAGLAEGAAGMWLGLVGASLLFGLAHAVTRVYVVLAGLVGMYLGGLWIVSGNLVAPVVAHGLYDFVAILWLLRRPGRLSTALSSQSAESLVQDPGSGPPLASRSDH